MYTFVIADDEELIRKGIRAIIQGSYPDAVIFEACDGAEAYDLAKRHNAHILLLDIKMPVYDGLKVLSLLNESGSDSQTALITGYSDFAYAKQALDHGAKGYILKPVVPKELLRIVEKMIGYISRKEMTLIDHASNRALRLEKLFNLLLTTPADMIDQQTRQDFLGALDKPAGLFQIALFRIDSGNFDCFNRSGMQREDAKRRLREWLKSRSGDRAHVLDNHKNTQEIFTLFCGEDGPSLDAVAQSFVDSACQCVRAEMGLRMTVAVGPPVGLIDGTVYERLRLALDLRFSMGCGRIYRTVDYPEIFGGEDDQKKLELLSRQMELRDYAGVKQTLRQLFHSSLRRDADEPCNVRQTYREILAALNATCHKLHIHSADVISEIRFSSEIIDYFDDGIQLSNYLYTTIINALQIDTHESMKTKNIIEMLVSYIDENHDKNYTVKELAAELAISPDYFSKLFKNATGQNFIEYVNTKKIQSACAMLCSSRLSVSDIAYSLGFQDIQYFFKLFKRIMKMTPLEYKRVNARDHTGLLS